MSATKRSAQISEEVSITHRVLLYNDDTTPYDFVVLALIGICNMTDDQAQQVTLIAHTKGKAFCFSGSYEECVAVSGELSAADLVSEVVSYE